MDRNYCTEAVVLKTGRLGDFHKTVTMLSPDAGIIDAVAHGAYKGRSKISSLTDPFCVSEFNLYHNPSRQQWKITGCESRRLNSGIKESLNAVSNASFWTELVLKTHASGADYSTVYRMLTSALSALDGNSLAGAVLSIHFVYRFLMLSGFISDYVSCGRCGRGTGSAEVYFSFTEGCFVCSRCSSEALPGFRRAELDYLDAAMNIELEEAVKKRLELETEIELRNKLVTVLRSVINVPLNTLDFLDYGLE